MKLLSIVALVLVSPCAVAEITTLVLPENAALVFEAPKMNKLKEGSDGGRYGYVATSLGESDERFNLSIYMEPIDCKYGKSLKDVARCFVDRLDSLPGVVKESDSASCSRTRCDIFYITTEKVGEKAVRQLHVNSLFTHGGGWLDVHFSVLNPTNEDSGTFARFTASLKFKR